MTSLEGTVVLVVGASGGLGSRIASLLESAGCHVVRAARNPATLSGPDAYLADLGVGAVGGGGAGGGAGGTPSPGSASRAAESLLLAAAAAYPEQLDGIVIAAGAVAFGPVDELSDDVLDELFAVNTLAPIRLIRGALPRLRDSAAAGRSPFIVTISGIVAESPTTGMAAYSASKAALASFVQAASRELRRAGIRLLDARPGHTETELSQHPLSGTAPKFPAGLSPDAVAERIVRAIVDDERDLPSSAFTA